MIGVGWLIQRPPGPWGAVNEPLRMDGVGECGAVDLLGGSEADAGVLMVVIMPDEELATELARVLDRVVSQPVRDLLGRPRRAPANPGSAVDGRIWTHAAISSQVSELEWVRK